MGNSTAASNSDTVVEENGSDPPDIPCTTVVTENIVEGGDLCKEIKKDEKENKSIEEMKDEVEEENAPEDLKEGADKSIESNDTDDKQDSKNKDEEEEKKDSEEFKDLKGTEDGEEMKEVGQTKEPKEKEGIGETMHFEGQLDEKKAVDGQEKKDGGETMELEVKEDVRETKHLERQKDTKEFEGEEKGFGGTKDEEGGKAVEETKHDDEGSAAKGEVNPTNNNMEEIIDLKGTEQKEDEVKGEAYKDVNSVELLKNCENKQLVQGINADEQKTDLGDENDMGNVSEIVKDKAVRAKKMPKEILKVKPENVNKKVVVDEKNKETIFNSGLVEGGVDDVEDEVGSEEEEDDEHVEKRSSRKKIATFSKKRRLRVEKINNKGEVKGELEAKEKKESGEKPKESLSVPVDTSPSSPVITSRERPVRERKVVERLVEVIEKEPNKSVTIEKGRGTPLKDIPNVAYKIARKKPVDLKFLHQTLFGRRGKLVDFKSHILQFSGFAWHETEEKQRARLKEKLDKCVKDDLLDICDLLDLSVSRTSNKKEEIIVKLVDFFEAPHATTDVILAEKEQSEKSRKRKRSAGGSASRRSGGTSKKSITAKSPAKEEGRTKSKGKILQEANDEDEEEDAENGISDEDAPRHSEGDVKENESSEASDGDVKNEDEDEDYGKGKQEMVQSPERQSPAIRERRSGSNSKKVSSQTEAISLVKTSASSNKQLKLKKGDTGEKVFSRRTKKESESPEASDDEGGSEDVDHLEKRNQDVKQFAQRQGSSVSKKRKRTESNSKKAPSQTAVKSSVKTPASSKQSKIEKDDTGEKVFTRKKKDADSPKKSSSKSSVKGKKSVKGKATLEEQRNSGPSKSDLRKTICETLKEVDFNTATFTDILKRLAAHYKMDLTPKKAAIKQMIQEELTKMADEAEDSEEEEEEYTEDAGKEETPKPAAKKVKA